MPKSLMKNEEEPRPRHKQYDSVDATFNPKRTEDLRAGADAWIGHRTTWEALGEIEEGPYAGEMAFAIEVGIQNEMRDRGEALPPFTWVCESDLEIHQRSEMTTNQWADIRKETEIARESIYKLVICDVKIVASGREGFMFSIRIPGLTSLGTVRQNGNVEKTFAEAERLGRAALKAEIEDLDARINERS